MKPLNFTTQGNQPLTIIPDTIAHINGHPVITYTYSIYQGYSDDARIELKKSRLHLEKHHDPNYLGYITFEKPDNLFTYTAHGEHPLDWVAVQEIVEFLTDIRNNPSSWRLS